MSIQYTTGINGFTGKENDFTGVTSSVSAANAIVIDLSKRQLKSIQLTCANHTSGNGVFGVEVSNDGTNWIDYNRLVSNVTNTNAQTDTRVGAPTLSSNISTIYFFPQDDLFRYIKFYVTITTDGTYYCQLQSAG